MTIGSILAGGLGYVGGTALLTRGLQIRGQPLKMGESCAIAAANIGVALVVNYLFEHVVFKEIYDKMSDKEWKPAILSGITSLSLSSVLALSVTSYFKMNMPAHILLALTVLSAGSGTLCGYIVSQLENSP